LYRVFPSCTLVSFVVNCVLLPPGTIHKAPDAVFQVDNIEVYKQAERFATQLELGKELGLMDGRDRVHRLNFDYNQILDQQINAIPQFELHAAINHRQTNLTG